MQRLMLRLQPYSLKVEYVPGTYKYAADTLSQAYVQEKSDPELEKDRNVMVHSLVAALLISASQWCRWGYMQAYGVNHLIIAPDSV